jgi:hypothetical protein
LRRVQAEVDFYDAEFAKCCPLHIASMQEDAAMLRRLLDLGADPR